MIYFFSFPLFINIYSQQQDDIESLDWNKQTSRPRITLQRFLTAEIITPHLGSGTVLYGPIVSDIIRSLSVTVILTDECRILLTETVMRKVGLPAPF